MDGSCTNYIYSLHGCLLYTGFSFQLDPFPVKSGEEHIYWLAAYIKVALKAYNSSPIHQPFFGHLPDQYYCHYCHRNPPSSIMDSTNQASEQTPRDAKSMNSVNLEQHGTMVPTEFEISPKDDFMKQSMSFQVDLQNLRDHTHKLHMALTGYANDLKTSIAMAEIDQSQCKDLEGITKQDSVSAEAVRSVSVVHNPASKKWDAARRMVPELSAVRLGSIPSVLEPYTDVEGGSDLKPFDIRRLNNDDLSLTVKKLGSNLGRYLALARNLQPVIATCAKSYKNISAGAEHGLSEIQTLTNSLIFSSKPTALEVSTSVQSLEDMVRDQDALFGEAKQCGNELHRAYSAWKQEDKETEL